MAKLKVYSGMEFKGAQQLPTIVAATSCAKASAALQAVGYYTTAHHIAKYWSVTGNDVAIAAAMSKPGAVFQSEARTGALYLELPVREVQP